MPQEKAHIARHAERMKREEATAAAEKRAAAAALMQTVRPHRACLIRRCAQKLNS